LVTNDNPCVELRALAALAQTGATEPQSLAALWHELTSGAIRIAHSFFTEDHCFLVLTECDSKIARAIAPNRLRVLEAVLAVSDIKSAAFELERSNSTVSQTAALALRELGLECTAARIPVLVALAALAARNRDFARRESSAVFVHDDRTYRAVWAKRPEDRLARILTSAEHAVVRGVIEGHPHDAIARRRGTSARTVANQLATAFRRLGISGRGSLMQYVLAAGDSLKETPLFEGECRER
jgi:DNA-binding CsgD family transcriptional regulator